MPSSAAADAAVERIDMHNVHTLTTYQLRQEIERRGLLGDLTTVNYNTLLQRLVQESVHDAASLLLCHIHVSTILKALVEEEREAERKETVLLKRLSEVPGIMRCYASRGTLYVQARLRREREERKQAALQRSIARQSDPAYFASKAQANVPPLKGSSAGAAAAAAAPAAEPCDAALSTEDAEPPLISKINPRGFKVYSR
ncbi:hypothetical protein JKP88DRAFT_268306 [Tribonema minus]|uniref:Uncharacterized protein n=1 Tax=Tribonema minus TaxID=303371 RepID=A0A836CHB1_9STRA|nr:hypothetical protein JKP88DRAFT_268306 [Tribonema minus]